MVEEGGERQVLEEEMEGEEEGEVEEGVKCHRARRCRVVRGVLTLAQHRSKPLSLCHGHSLYSPLDQLLLITL